MQPFLCGLCDCLKCVYCLRGMVKVVVAVHGLRKVLKKPSVDLVEICRNLTVKLSVKSELNSFHSIGHWIQ